MAEAALSSVRHLRAGGSERAALHENVRKLRNLLRHTRIPFLDRPSHIVPVMVGDPVKCKAISDLLIERHAIYVQPINYPTVSRGTERLRITTSPAHTDAMAEALVAALAECWCDLRLPLAGNDA